MPRRGKRVSTVAVHNIDEKSIFNVAREIGSAEARAKYLRQVCGDNSAAEERILQLLHNFEKRPSFLEAPAGKVEVTTDHSTGAATVGAQIGALQASRADWRGGGMGEVLRRRANCASQTQGRAQDHQARHGQQGRRGALRGGATSLGHDGSS